MGRSVITAAVLLALLTGPAAAAKAPGRAESWARDEIRLVTSAGLMGGSSGSFRPDDPLTADELAELLAALTGKPAASSANPAAPVTIARLDARLVHAVGLGPAAARFAAGARSAGLAPPGRFGTEVVARLLGLRADHPPAEDVIEPAPSDVATRAEAAHSAAKILGWRGGEAQWVRALAAGFSPPAVSGWRRSILRTAVSLVGYPYVWGGTSERRQAPLGSEVPGGFDCSGLVWRVYKLAPYAAGTELPDLIQGRTTFELSAEAAPAVRAGLARLDPADLLFFGPRGRRSEPAEIDHIGVYLGGGWFVQASGQGVSLAPLEGWYRPRFAFARRPLAEAGLA